MGSMSQLAAIVELMTIVHAAAESQPYRAPEIVPRPHPSTASRLVLAGLILPSVTLQMDQARCEWILFGVAAFEFVCW